MCMVTRSLFSTQSALANNSLCLAIIITNHCQLLWICSHSMYFPSEAPPRISVRLYTFTCTCISITAQATPRGMYCKYRNRLSIASPIQTEHTLILMAGRSLPHFFHLSRCCWQRRRVSRGYWKIISELSYHESSAAFSASIVKRRE